VHDRPGIVQRRPAGARPDVHPGRLQSWHGRCSRGAQVSSMTDLFLVALTFALFAATVGFVRLCERM
jgi:hypothetical protein